MERKGSDIGYSSIDKVKQILNCFSCNKPNLTVHQIAKQVDIPMSSLYRYLQSLVSAKFLSHNKSMNTYSLGTYMIEMAGISLMQYEIRYAALPEMNELSAKSNMNVNLSILDGCDVFHLAYSIRYFSTPWIDAIGRRTPAYQTAMGLSMLAFQPFEDVRMIIEQANAESPSTYPLPDFDDLKKNLEIIRQKQIAIAKHENQNNYNYNAAVCMACPVRRKNSEICAAISVNWYEGTDRSTYEKAFAPVQPLLIQTAANISYKLGYVGRSYGSPF